MAKLPQHARKRLEDAGLDIFPPFPTNHIWPDGVRIGLPQYHTRLDAGDGNVITGNNGPTAVLYSHDGKIWGVDAIQGTGGFLPGDFVDYWFSPEDAVEDVLDFFSENSLRMHAKRQRQVSPSSAERPATVPRQALEGLQRAGLTLVHSYGAEGGRYDGGVQITMTEKTTVRFYPCRGGWFVDAYSNCDPSGSELQEGAFMHFWPTWEEALIDVRDFFSGNGVRWRAWAEAQKVTAQAAR